MHCTPFCSAFIIFNEFIADKKPWMCVCACLGIYFVLSLLLVVLAEMRHKSTGRSRIKKGNGMVLNLLSRCIHESKGAQKQLVKMGLKTE